MQEDLLPELFKGPEEKIPGKELTWLLVNQSVLGLPDIDMSAP